MEIFLQSDPNMFVCSDWTGLEYQRCVHQPYSVIYPFLFVCLFHLIWSQMFVCPKYYLVMFIAAMVIIIVVVLVSTIILVSSCTILLTIFCIRDRDRHLSLTLINKYLFVLDTEKTKILEILDLDLQKSKKKLIIFSSSRAKVFFSFSVFVCFKQKKNQSKAV